MTGYYLEELYQEPLDIKLKRQIRYDGRMEILCDTQRKERHIDLQDRFLQKKIVYYNILKRLC